MLKAEAAAARVPLAPTRLLPVHPRPPIGRAREVDDLRRLLLGREARLITLTGPGGVGKTRLAVAAAEAVASAFADGVVFVDLAPLRDPTLVLPEIADVLGVREATGRPVAAELRQMLHATELLLLLDNCEQVLEAAPQIGTLLSACPGLAVLATSREPLGLRWEQVYPVAPLALPDPRAEVSADTVGRSPAGALFVQHARAVRPAFALTGANAGAIAEICRRLDGLPLAIELAAARSRMLPPEAMLTQLRQRPFLLLTGGARDAPERHRTLREAIAWSHDLLSADEQAVFRRLAVLAGDWTLEAAEALAGDLPALANLESLVDKHLVQVEDTAGEPRFRLLETIRQYALERLRESDEEPMVQRALAGYVLALAEQAAPALQGPEQRLWLDRLGQELENVRATLDWCAETDEPGARELGLRLAGALWLFWRVRGLVHEGRTRLDQLLAGTSGVSVARARALYAAGYLAFAQGDAVPAADALRNAVEMARATGDTWTEAYALQGLGHAALLEGDLETAAALYRERLAIARERGDTYGLAQALNALGEVARCAADVDQASQWYTESLALRRQIGDTRGVGMGLANLGHVAVARGDATGARAAFTEGLALLRGLDSQYGIAVCLSGLAAVALAEQQPERAARLLGAAEALLDVVGSSLEPSDRLDHQRTTTATQEALGTAEFEALRAAGHTLDLDAAVTLATAPPVPQPAPAAQPAAAPREPSGAPSELHLLTTREREVAGLIARGLTSKEIAEALIMSERTADAHADHIRTKLALRSRAEIAAWATRHGLGETSDAAVQR